LLNDHFIDGRLLGQSSVSGRAQLHLHAYRVRCLFEQAIPQGEPPRSYLERLYNIRRWTVFPHGGHFAPAEKPAAIAGDIRAFLRDLS
jgi:pimeloyl-ACP methyl ester carboxylesterase